MTHIDTRTRLKALIQTKGISQKQLALETDIAEYRISLICSGKSNDIKLSTINKICKYLGCSLDEAFGDTVNFIEE